jgi:N-acetylglutamate synthase
MDISRNDRIAMERAHVHAWPARRTRSVEGWLWRSSGGGSQRANSVSTIDFEGNDPAAAIETAEAAYAALGAIARFQTFDETRPANLADLLLQRGYREGEATTTMFRSPSPGGPVNDVEVRDHAWGEWLDVYLQEITEDRRAANRVILGRIPGPRAFFGCRREGRIVATALGVVSHGCAVIECVATSASHRRQGAAQQTLRALQAWAAPLGVSWLGLQVVATNAPAVALYQRMGFVSGATNRFWVKG